MAASSLAASLLLLSQNPAIAEQTIVRCSVRNQYIVFVAGLLGMVVDTSSLSGSCIEDTNGASCCQSFCMPGFLQSSTSDSYSPPSYLKCMNFMILLPALHR